MDRLEVNSLFPDQFGNKFLGELSISIRGLVPLRIWITLFNKHNFMKTEGNKALRF